VQTEPGPSPLIQLRDFVYRYPPLLEGGEPVTALDGITLDVAAGEFLGVTGSTASGKSTLCLALNGLVPHATGGSLRGEVVVAGMNSKQASVPELATRVGLVFQDPESNLVGLTVEDEVAFGPENLGIAPSEIARRVAWALDAVGMAGERERSSAHLSGGQKQRVAIAAVLAMAPQVLVLDEPTAQLDPAGKYEVAAAIEALRRGAGARAGLTVVMVEQDAELLGQFADRVIVLDAGRIALEGTPREVFRRVDDLARLGIYAPQVAEVAQRLSPALGTPFDFLTETEAARALAPLLEPRGDD
jgi:energy-coupling factor transporter ATP-binding protein EcfA2